MLSRRFSDEQQLVIDALTEKRFNILPTRSDQFAMRLVTSDGIEVDWLHGLGDGKSVRIQSIPQPEYVAKRVRDLLDDAHA